MPDGKGKPANAIRRWSRNGLVTGVHQHSKNAEYRLNGRGVREAWRLWAAHKELDPEAHMPKEIRQMLEQEPQVQVNTGTASDGTPTVRIEVPPGVAVEVVYKAA